MESSAKPTFTRSIQARTNRKTRNGISRQARLKRLVTAVAVEILEVTTDIKAAVQVLTASAISFDHVSI
jgi:hypothetical protein